MMFNQLIGSQSAISDQMDREVERLYAMLVTHYVRKPTSPSAVGKLPIWICAPDMPVFKHKQNHLRDVVANDGAHRHAIALTPPQSRMIVNLDAYIHQEQRYFSGCDKALFRFHAEKIDKTPEKAVGYAIKSVKNDRHGRGADGIMILPKTRAEALAERLYSDEPFKATR